jgi:hypothetical protein
MEKDLCAIVKKQRQAWEDAYYDNNQRGKDMIDFGAVGIQWEDGVPNDRKSVNKESLTFNLCHKHRNKIISQYKQLRFNLGVYSNNRKTYNSGELSAFKMLSNHFFMSDDVAETADKALEKMIDFGYSFVEVAPERQNNETLSLMPSVRLNEDPTSAFWDFNARTPCKIDGNYVGIVYPKVPEQEIYIKYPGSRNKNFIKKQNEVIRYWYRAKETAEFIKLKGGEYLRTDLVEEDVDEIWFDAAGKSDVKKGEKDCIYFVVICNNHILKEPEIYPTEDLPVPYHPGLTVWSPNGWVTLPFVYPLVGAQQLHNYTMSQLATAAKNASSTKVYLTPDHIQTNLQKETAENINQIEGAVVLGKDPDGVQPVIVPPAEVPNTMLNLATQTKQEIDEISGAFIDSELSSQTVLSGKALGLITQNMSISSIHAGLIAAHISFLSSICRLMQQMIPKIITEQRCISIRKDDGTSEDIYVNQLLKSGKIKNNIKDIQNAFLYRIDCSPSQEMQQENTVKALSMFYAAPQTIDFANTKDIFARNLPIEDAAEFEKRVSSSIDPVLISYSNGETTKEEFMKHKQQQQMQQQQMQQSILQQQQKAAQDLSDAEKSKAAAMQYREETNRMKAIDESKQKNADLWIKFMQANSEDISKRVSQELEKSGQEIEVAKFVTEQFNQLGKHGNT